VLVGSGNAFAAGLFLAIGLLHFLPHATEAFALHGSVFPTASLLALGAFLLLLLLEHVLLPDSAHRAAHEHSGEGSHGHGAAGHPGPGPDALAGTSPYILVVALSTHSVLAGFALGADSDAHGALLTFLAIIVHKSTAGLALGLALLAAATPPRRALRLVLAFALMTPAGIVLGVVAGGLLSSDMQLLFDGGATALAAGTFLYIGAFDLLQDEFLLPGRRWAKWLAAVSGAALASLVMLWV
jgi:zinc transporter 1/2/3